jgi:putative DNA primase/helicase
MTQSEGYESAFEADGVTDAESLLVVPAPGNPMAVARQFVAQRYTGTEDVLLIRHHRGDFYLWNWRCWPEAEDRKVKAELYRWLEPAHYYKKTKAGYELVPFEPTRYKIANLTEALQAVSHLDADITAPAWLDAEHEGSADLVAMENGLVDLRSRELLPHNPAFFTHHALPFAYDPNAPTPERWHRFLVELWDDDSESIDTLAEVMGYILAGGTGQQKMAMLVGPKRSGKGTIARVMGGLLGAHNTAAPTLASLTTNFGLAPLVGKPLAVISDARLGTRADGLVAVERLLSISGEDAITIDRKYREPWTGQLPTRFLILTNELPRFTDSSGALASRFVLLTLTKSFYGREDPALTEQLLTEAAGIFNWALAGLDRLLDRGHFLQPTSGREALRHLEDLSSPVGSFVRDMCETGAAFQVGKDILFDAWKSWCEEEGRDRPGTKAIFTRDLKAAVPGVIPKRPRVGEGRSQIYQGIALRSQSPASLTSPDQEAPGQDGQGRSGVSPNASDTREQHTRAR